MSVKSDLDRAFQKKVVGLQEKVVRATALNIDKDLVAQTPVDTGRARSNWLPSVGAPRNDVVDSKVEIEPVISSYRINETIYIANNLPYIERLNNGHSQQNTTPSWVEATVEKHRVRMKAAIKEIARGL